jgi:hypothetical protein
MITTRYDVRRKYERGFYKNKSYAVYMEGAAFQIVVLEIVHGINDGAAGYIQMFGEQKKDFFFRRIYNGKEASYFNLGLNRYRLDEFIKVAA